METRGKGIKIFKLGFSDKEDKAKLWDFADDAVLKASQPTSTLSSLYAGVIEDLYKQKSKSFRVKLTTISAFCKKNGVKIIDFLKVDTEGSEYAVLKGAKDMISQGRIRVILFEFNETNVVSRVFFKDFVELLEHFRLYRLMRRGLLPISRYQPKIHEIFAFQNIIAISKKEVEVDTILKQTL